MGKNTWGPFCLFVVFFSTIGLHYLPVPADLNDFDRFVIAERIRRASGECSRVTDVYIREFWSDAQKFEVHCGGGFRYTRRIDEAEPRVYVSHVLQKYSSVDERFRLHP